ncbi:hypothetical protein HHK36_014216 [Tetracentron sinense]|uniref:Uncharacterized protein n=1 Tax=Tetracentron sinense TaxID=13715 RepID=A0A834Z9E1_TETSI|nr:hypothetical protein HHK36_014216 [Tetracentron sinense]
MYRPKSTHRDAALLAIANKGHVGYILKLAENDVEAYDEYFVQRKDCCSRLVCSSVQKMIAAVCILAYGLSAYDEYLKIGESTAIESLKRFCETVITLYEGQYLRSPNEQDICTPASRRGREGVYERGIDVERWRPPPDETISPLEYARNPAILVAHISSRLSRIRNRGTNTMQMFDLMEHLWNKFGDEAI